jgi:hypothetical protein
MIKEIQRSSSWVGKVVLIAVAVLASNMHAGGSPERAVAVGGAALVVGVVLGLGMVAIVLTRLFGRNIGLIRSDLAALLALLVMITVKIAIARTLLPL